MLCQKCHKNEATIHIQQIVNGKVMASHLCQQCAAENGEFPDGNGVNLAEILFDLADKVAGKIVPEENPKQKKSKRKSEAEKTLVCPTCNWDWERFQKTGYLGCPECYKIFEPLIQPMLKKMHKGEIHTGKTPLKTEIDRKAREQSLLQRQIMLLQKDLELHVSREEYEAAAKLRDEIQKLRSKMQAGE